MREAIDRAGLAYPEYLPGRAPSRAVADRDRPGHRGRPLPGRSRGEGGRPPPARLRRAARPPGRDGRAASPAGPLPGPAARRRRRPPTTPIRAALAASLSGQLGRTVELTADQDAATSGHPERPRRATSRCSGSSRATSARARRRWPPTPWRSWPGPAGRAPSSPRPTCSPASTGRPSATCSSGLGIPVTLLTGSLGRGRDTHRPRGDRRRPGRGGRRDPRPAPGPGRRSPTSGWWSSTSSTASGSSSAASSRRRPAGRRRTSCS